MLEFFFELFFRFFGRFFSFKLWIFWILFGLFYVLYIFFKYKKYEEVIQVHDAVSKDEIKNFMISKSIKTASVQKKTKSVILTDKDSSKLYLFEGSNVYSDIDDGSLFFNT
ncbi:MAG: hypothetical protein IJR94_05640 [Synergistaceae bacterium]|nr:hypothetical protein [Synergistaceae bacterium]